jgi:hypothetical protein
MRAADSRVFLLFLRRAVTVKWRLEASFASIPEELDLLPRIIRVLGPSGFGEREPQMRALAVSFCRYASVLVDELSIGSTDELRLASQQFTTTLRANVSLLRLACEVWERIVSCLSCGSCGCVSVLEFSVSTVPRR